MDDLDFDREVTLFALRIAQTIRKEDYLFTVTVGTPWDVYKFTSSRGDGTLAFRMVDDASQPTGRSVEIGFFRRGSFTADDVTKALSRDAPS